MVTFLRVSGRGRPFFLPSGTEDLGRHQGRGVQVRARNSSRERSEPRESFASLWPGAQRRPWPCTQRTAGHNRKPEGKLNSAEPETAAAAAAVVVALAARVAGYRQPHRVDILRPCEFGPRSPRDPVPSGGNCHGLQANRRRTSPLANSQRPTPGRASLDPLRVPFANSSIAVPQTPRCRSTSRVGVAEVLLMGTVLLVEGVGAPCSASAPPESSAGKPADAAGSCRITTKSAIWVRDSSN